MLESKLSPGNMDGFEGWELDYDCVGYGLVAGFCGDSTYYLLW
jgi:hypothetical protein